MYPFKTRSWQLGLLLWAALLTGCVDTVELKMPSSDKLLVINGLVSTDPGPYFVRINLTSPYGAGILPVDQSIRDAVVRIEDEKGNVEVLAQQEYGLYRTSPYGMRGRVGGEYTLTVTLKDGRVYQSKTEVMPAVPAIEGAEVVYEEKTVLNSDNLEVPDNRYHVLLSTQDPAEQRNFYRWDWTGVYEVSTQPWEYVERDPRTGKIVPRPKSCCTTCWVKDSVNAIQVTDDRLFNGNMVRGQRVASIPVTAQTFNIRYRVELRQYSLTEDAFEYWRVLGIQTAKTGSVLDPPPANPRGNIFNVNNPDEQVMGFFGASAVARKILNLRREDLASPPPVFDYDDDCRILKNSTTLRPSFW
ncbi:MAG: DUF4249 domain-containing protein [Rufibacter sp.]